MLRIRKRRTSKNSIDVISIKEGVDNLTIKRQMKKAPELKSTRQALEKCIKAVHAIPNMFRQVEGVILGNLIVYIGISNNPCRRFPEHSRNRKGEYALIIGKASGKKTAEYESVGIKFLKYLISKKGLCVGSLENIKERSKSVSGISYIYILFSIDKRFNSFGLLSRSPDQLSKYSNQFEWILEENRLSFGRDYSWLSKVFLLTTNLKSKSRLVYCHQK
jgi:hypothetical protein